MNSKENKILHKELSYKLQGLFYAIRNDLGSGHKESIYQRALARELKDAGMVFQKEPAIKIYSAKKEYLGLYRPDFLIDNKVIIELKAAQFVTRQEAARLYDYLRNSEYELAYLVNFASSKLYIRRYIFTNDRKNSLRISTNVGKTAVKLLLFVAISLASLFVAIRGVSGAELFFGAHSREVGVEKNFEVGVFVNTEGRLVNAIEGEVIFPSDLELVEIRDGNSILNLWIKRPQLVEAGRVSFAGIIPGGYFGDRGYLFSLILRAKDEGRITITTSDERILLNDGQGTPTDVRRAPLSIDVSGGAITEEFSPPLDSDPPEPFTPIISRNPSIFDNQYFLVFATQDKGSGIKEYQIQERKFFKEPAEKGWTTAESPYLLKDQKLRSRIFVRAIDKVGNERMATLPPQTPWYKDYAVWGIITLIIISAYLIRRNLWKKLLRHKSPRILAE